ncbi:MAG: dethiobiotin synthase [Cyclobacteriaceae bacterium]
MKEIKNYFITAISTDSGKTVASAIVTHALNADYWKPIQSGAETDSQEIKRLLPQTKIHKEAYLLTSPESPNSAAEKDNVSIKLGSIKLPHTDNHLIIEGAGGVLVPLNEKDVVGDIAHHLSLETIVVSNFYLGSINHTLLTIEVLKAKGIKIKGLIFNGEDPNHSKEIILKKTGLQELLHISTESVIDTDIIKKYAKELKEKQVV